MEQALKINVRLDTWALPAEGDTLEQLHEILRFQGVKILEVDRANNRIKVDIGQGT